MLSYKCCGCSLCRPPSSHMAAISFELCQRTAGARQGRYFSEMVCPMRMIITIAAALGLASYLGPMAISAAGLKEKTASANRLRLSHRLALWLGSELVLALHADLLLSLGYTRCAFQSAVGLHRLLVS
mmetsp:Transcript_132748/g.424726  ORF Transcript_132748/g.424726 Transcript_132748/m.424726 type:complete len:128 (+) Transcript_132748:107-490(+)